MPAWSCLRLVTKSAAIVTSLIQRFQENLAWANRFPFGPGNWPEFRKRVTLFSKKLGLTYSVSVSGRKSVPHGIEDPRRRQARILREARSGFTVGSGDLGRSYMVAKGTRYLFRRSRIIRGFADGISRLVMRPAGSGALHGPPGIFVFVPLRNLSSHSRHAKPLSRPGLSHLGRRL